VWHFAHVQESPFGIAIIFFFVTYVKGLARFVQVQREPYVEAIRVYFQIFAID